MDHVDGSDGVLMALSIGTLVVFYLIFAALHDIAHGEPDLTAEYCALVLSGAGFAVLYRAALSALSRRNRMIWLSGAGAVLLLLNAAAVNATVHPKYLADPMLGAVFLVAGAPLVTMMGFHLLREARR